MTTLLTIGHGTATAQELVALLEGAGMERLVDVHAFTPGALQTHAGRAGFENVRVSGEELAASLLERGPSDELPMTIRAAIASWTSWTAARSATAPCARVAADDQLALSL